MGELSTVEKYALAQILVCGKINKQEFKEMNDFLGEVQDAAIDELHAKGILDEHTLMK